MTAFVMLSAESFKVAWGIVSPGRPEDFVMNVARGASALQAAAKAVGEDELAELVLAGILAHRLRAN